MKIVGTVQQINLYPVKSMQGVAVEKARCYWYGLDGDRKYAFVHQDAETGFPWLTARELPQLLQYQPHFASPDTPMNSRILVETPSGKRFALDSKELESELLSSYGKSVSLLKLNRGTFDAMPISLLTQTSLQTLQRESTQTLDARRFRANILINTASSQPFPEFAWANSLLIFGSRSDSAQLNVNQPAKRCMVVNLDPETGESNPDVLKTVVSETEGFFSIYASVHKLGSIEVGDTIFLQSSAQ